MSAFALEKLHVLVTGVDAAIALEVVRLAADEGARVTVAGVDPARLGRLTRDVGLCRARVETAVVDLQREGAVRTWEASMRVAGRLPQLMICCCAAPRSGRTARRAVATQAGDVALSEQHRKRCPAQLAQRLFGLSLVLHAEPLRRSMFDRAIAVLRHPTLRGMLDRVSGRGAFSPGAAAAYARNAGFPSRLAGPEGPSRRRLRFVPPESHHADAA